MDNKEKVKLISVNALLWMIIGLYTPFLSSFLLLKGMSTSEIGIIIAIYPIMSVLVVPFWGKISDQSQSKNKILYILCFATAITGLGFYLAKSFLEFIMATSVFTFFLVALTPLLDSFLTGICKTKKAPFSFLRIGGTVGYAFIVLAYGFILNAHVDFQFVSISFLAIILFILLRHIDYSPDLKEVLKQRDKMKVKRREIFTNKKIFFVLTMVIICQFGVSFVGNFMGVFLIEEGITRAMIGSLNFVSAFSEIPILIIAEKIIRKFKIEHILFFGSATVIIRIVLFSMGNILLMFISQLLQSTSYMLVYYSAITFVVSHVQSGREAQGQSILFIAQNGVSATLSSLMGGTILNYLGAKNSFLFIALLIGICVIGVLCFTKIKFRRNF